MVAVGLPCLPLSWLVHVRACPPLGPVPYNSPTSVFASSITVFLWGFCLVPGSIL